MPGLRVFLSSTATDLVDYRRIADDTLLRLQNESVVMERFGPLPGAPVAECEQRAASSDLVVCIVAHRYGSEPEKGHGSITRREVQAAHRAGKRVFAWIIDDEYTWDIEEQDRLTQPDVFADPTKVLDVVAAVKGLHDFKAWLRENFVTDSFTTADDLGRRIATALAHVAADSAVGRAESAASDEHPRLEVTISAGPPHAINTPVTVTGKTLNPIDAVSKARANYYRVGVQNRGESTVAACRVVLTGLWYLVQGVWRGLNSWEPMPLTWSNLPGTIYRDLSPGEQAYCDVGHVFTNYIQSNAISPMSIRTLPKDGPRRAGTRFYSRHVAGGSDGAA